MKFRPGDIALIRSLPEIHPEYHGREVVILTSLLDVPKQRFSVYAIEIEGIAKKCYAAPHQLKPLPPPDIKLAGWDECPWKPSRNSITLRARIDTSPIQRALDELRRSLR